MNKLLLAVVVCSISGCIDQNTKRANVGADALRNGNCSLAYSALHQLAMEGNPEAENNIGVFYDRGCPENNQAVDLVLAAEWFDKAAQHGNVMGKRNAAQHAERGLGQRADVHKAIGLYWAAAEDGDEVSLQRLAALGRGDLVQQVMAKREAAQAERAATIEAIAQALGAAVAATQHTAPPPIQPYPAAQFHPTPMPAPEYHPAPITPIGACNYDMDCGIGRVCVKPQGQIGLAGC